ncbi:MAG: hypothetical protein ABW162_15025 [Candidatus Sedimenticola sp. PURPLELP]
MRLHLRPWITACPTLGLLLMLSLPASSNEQGTPVQLKEKAPFERLVDTLATADAAQRQDFAWIALSEIAHAYELELMESKQETLSSEKRLRKLIRWRKGIRGFIEQLHALIERLPTLTEIEIQPAAAGPSILFIGNNPVVLSGPENGMAKFMERRIIDSYCSLYDCSALDEQPEPQPDDEQQLVGRGKWIFEHHRQARYETPDNLVFVFSDLAERSKKQEACDRIAEELRMLASAIRRAKRAGYPIDWSSLVIEPLNGNSKSHVLLNTNGDYLQLELPSLLGGELLDEETVHWTRKKSNGESAPETVIDMKRILNLT